MVCDENFVIKIKILGDICLKSLSLSSRTFGLGEVSPSHHNITSFFLFAMAIGNGMNLFAFLSFFSLPFHSFFRVSKRSPFTYPAFLLESIDEFAYVTRSALLTQYISRTCPCQQQSALRYRM